MLLQDKFMKEIIANLDLDKKKAELESSVLLTVDPEKRKTIQEVLKKLKNLQGIETPNLGINECLGSYNRTNLHF